MDVVVKCHIDFMAPPPLTIVGLADWRLGKNTIPPGDERSAPSSIPETTLHNDVDRLRHTLLRTLYNPPRESTPHPQPAALFSRHCTLRCTADLRILHCQVRRTLLAPYPWFDGPPYSVFTPGTWPLLAIHPYLSPLPPTWPTGIAKGKRRRFWLGVSRSERPPRSLQGFIVGPPPHPAQWNIDSRLCQKLELLDAPPDT